MYSMHTRPKLAENASCNSLLKIEKADREALTPIIALFGKKGAV